MYITTMLQNYKKHSKYYLNYRLVINYEFES
jgi:hypothetical protein